MAKTRVAMVAQEIRKELKATFPNVKFSVRSSNYSMGSSINVEWDNLPTQAAVEAITNKYACVRRCEATGEILSGGNMYVTAQPNFTAEFKVEVEAQMEEHEINDQYWRGRAFDRIITRMWEAQNTSAIETVEEAAETVQIETNTYNNNQNNNQATLNINNDKNGIEIKFEFKPSTNVIEGLKAMGFRWSSYSSVWWAKQTPDRLKFATMFTDSFNDITVEEPATIENEDVVEAQDEKEEPAQDQPEQENEMLTDTIIINGKIKVKEITFLWSESSMIKDNLTVTTFAEAEESVRLIASNVRGGYDKTKFVITWTDGDTYTGRLDVEKKDENKQTPIKDHITDWLQFLTVDKKPSHMSVEQYHNTLKAYAITEEDKKLYYDFFEKYALTDMEPIEPDNVVYYDFGISQEQGEEEEINIDNFDNILSKFDSIEVTTDSKIATDDLEFCKEQEEIYKKLVSTYANFYAQLQEISTQAKEHGNKFGRQSEAYIHEQKTAHYHSMRIWDYEEAIIEMKNSFIMYICSYFMKNYSVTIDYQKIQNKYDLSVTYELIIDEIYLQLGGYNFTEKAEQEIKEEVRDIFRHGDKINIKNTKLILDGYFARHDSIWKIYRLGSKHESVFKALQHFEDGSTSGNVELIGKYCGYDNERNQANFERYEPLTIKSVKSIKFLKNGKLEIEFNTNKLAAKFAHEYCGYIQKSA
ncbi:hypothetical protein NV379_02485 [Paenibacillus sp. N1-5-1-14]|uniref:LPD29 domain-containing protein n=1 Tax=Paenibacillus radicibacter TaxID=2972488 RepID=UPI00215999F2|nr:LPD29 domain-containing protein [Paenibacillus radicibacter]MCR8641514.1 hypothetical protein [Paenibacillus radicibacter]